MTAPLLRDVFDIPEATGSEDYVLRLTDATTGRGAAEAIDDYVVTPAIATAFDQALALISDALDTGLNRGAFLAGSFGSGKSHFMAVLHAILRHDPHARAHRDLQGVITRHDAQLEGKNFLPLSFHFLDGRSMEHVLFDGYVRQIRDRHPEAALPAVYQADALLQNAESLRRSMGDDAFLARLGEEGASDDVFGALLGTSGWSIEDYHRSRAAAPSTAERQRLVTALTRPDGLFSSYARFGEYVSLDEGLQAISTHAQALGYDAVVMFLDELVLWLAFEMQNQGGLGREAQKLTKLVEGNYGRLPIPLVSVIARQMELTQWFADSGDSGAQQKALDDAFNHQSSRFHVIELGTDNLAFVAAKRLLTPKDENARRAIDEAFAQIDRVEGVWDVLLDGINTDDTHRGSSEQQFRLTYPFSPALVSTLRELSGVMQRDRTALKVMQQMLVERRDTMTIDEVIPVGDAYEHIVAGNDRSVLDPRRAALFRRADEIFAEKIQPQLLTNNQVTVHDLASGDEQKLRRYRNDERLAHTLLLSAVAPGVPALTSLTPQRLSSLNHGSITSPLKGREANVVDGKIRSWAQRVGDIKIGGTDRAPVYTVHLSDVDYESIIEKAKGEDNPGRQRELLQRLVLEAAAVPQQDLGIDGALQHRIAWRGSNRTVDLVFGNVRDPQQLPEDRFRAAHDTWRIILDLPFDQAGHSFADDVLRINDLLARNLESRTLIWLPRFFSERTRKDLRTLVILDYLLTGQGDRWRSYSDHLSEADRTQAKVILQGQHDTLRTGIINALLQAYGAATPQPGVLTEGSGDQVLWSLDRVHQPRTPGGPTLSRALEQTISEAWDSTYPEHPVFTPEDQPVTPRELDAVIEHLTRAAADPDHRVPLQGNVGAVRRIADPLQVGRTSETHFLFGADHFGSWDRAVITGLGQNSIDPEGPVRIDELHNALRSTEIGAGLEQRVLDLVAIAWAIRHQRAWTQYEAPIQQPVPGKLASSMELRPQAMPTAEQWATVGDRAGAIFGIEAPQYLTAANVTWLAQKLRDRACEWRDSAHALHQALTAASATRGITTSARLTAAGQGAALVDDLAVLKGLPLLQRLADADLEPSDQELGRSLYSADSVTRALQQLDSDRIAPLAAGAAANDDASADARGILQQLDDALAGHQLHTRLEIALAAFDDAAWRWVSRRASAGTAPAPAPQEKPQPATAARTQRRTLTWRAGDGLTELTRELTEQVPDGTRIEITWRELP